MLGVSSIGRPTSTGFREDFVAMPDETVPISSRNAYRVSPVLGSVDTRGIVMRSFFFLKKVSYLQQEAKTTAPRNGPNTVIHPVQNSAATRRHPVQYTVHAHEKTAHIHSALHATWLLHC